MLQFIVSFMLKSKTTSSKLLGYKIAVISQATSKAKKQHRKKQQPQKKYNQLFTAAGNVGYVFFLSLLLLFAASKTSKIACQ